MASAKQIAWRKKFAKLYGKKKKGTKSTKSKKSGYTPATLSQYDSHAQVKGKKKTSNPHNDDGYYITKEGSLFVLRQKRFKDRLDRGKKEHPHDVMAYGRTRAEINRMRKMITKS